MSGFGSTASGPPYQWNFCLFGASRRNTNRVGIQHKLAVRLSTVPCSAQDQLVTDRLIAARPLHRSTVRPVSRRERQRLLRDHSESHNVTSIRCRANAHTSRSRPQQEHTGLKAPCANASGLRRDSRHADDKQQLGPRRTSPSLSRTRAPIPPPALVRRFSGRTRGAVAAIGGGAGLDRRHQQRLDCRLELDHAERPRPASSSVVISATTNIVLGVALVRRARQAISGWAEPWPGDYVQPHHSKWQRC